MGHLAQAFRPLLKPWTLHDPLGRSIGYTNWALWLLIPMVFIFDRWFNWVIFAVIASQIIQFAIHFKREQRRQIALDTKYKKILDEMGK